MLQLKYDGWWCKAVCLPDRTEFYSDTDRLFATSGPTLPGAVLIGEMMRGTQWSQHPERRGKMFLYDAWQINDEPLDLLTYVQRISRLRAALFAAPYLGLPDVFRMVDNYRIGERDAVWNTFVIQRGYEGIVYRRTSGPIDDTLYREKRLFTFDGQIISVDEGEGKHAGRMGALRVVINHKGQLVETSVGTGFSDAEREWFWANRNTAVGKWIEFTANAQFESGNVRHGRYVRLRDDR